jgi:hypothetical protein
MVESKINRSRLLLSLSFPITRRSRDPAVELIRCLDGSGNCVPFQCAAVFNNRPAFSGFTLQYEDNFAFHEAGIVEWRLTAQPTYVDSGKLVSIQA